MGSILTWSSEFFQSFLDRYKNSPSSKKKYIQEVLEMPTGLKGRGKEVFLERLSTMAVKKLEFSLHLSVLYLIN